MADNKGKTKAAMLQELESIKGLLRDEDDIPILQEVIADAEQIAQPALAKHDLDELHTQFQQLSQTISGNSSSEHSRGAATEVTSESLLAAFNRASQQQSSQQQPTQQPADQPPSQPTPATKSGIPEQQTSLFLENPEMESPHWGNPDQESSYFSRADFKSSAESPSVYQPVAQPETKPHLATENIRSVAKTAEPTRTYDEGNPLAPAGADSDSSPPRSPLAKASGENPFLPQHIRARLHGNNPPPLFDFSLGKNSPASTGKHTEDKLVNRTEGSPRQRLIQDVVASVLPQLEKELRKRLEELGEQELEQIHERG